MNEFFESQANIETSLTDANCFQHARIAKLTENDLFVKLVRALFVLFVFRIKE
jgi:hypothetical protein